MTIATIVTRGFGSFAGVNYIPTRGYLPTIVPPPTPSTSVPGPADGTDHLKRIRREKVQQDNDLLRLLLLLTD